MAKPFYIPNPITTAFDNSGVIVPSGAKLFQYQAGTTTKISTYPTQTDAINGTNANANPLIASSAGRFSAVWSTQSTKLVCAPSNDTDPPTSPYWTADNLTSLAQTIQHSLKTSAYVVTKSDRDVFFEIDCSGGPVTLTLLAASSAGDGFRIQVKKIDSSTNALTITPNGTDNIDGANSSLTFSIQNDYVALVCDGTQWYQEIPHTFGKASFSNAVTVAGNVSLTGGSSNYVADGVTIGKLFNVESTLTNTNLASAGKVNVVVATGSQQFKIRNIILANTQQATFSGGSGRTIALTDGTTTWTTIPNASLTTLPSSAMWCSTAVPSTNETTASVAGANIYFQYAGGSSDFTAGKVIMIVTLEKIA